MEYLLYKVDSFKTFVLGHQTLIVNINLSHGLSVHTEAKSKSVEGGVLPGFLRVFLNVLN